MIIRDREFSGEVLGLLYSDVRLSLLRGIGRRRLWSNSFLLLSASGISAIFGFVSSASGATEATEGADMFVGNGGVDIFDGLGGDDIISGGAGDDIISGGSGVDFIYGGSDSDTLDGGSGSDTIYGNSGSDTIYGGLGNDTLDGGSGNDTLDGGSGDDILRGGFGDDIFLVSLGSDTIRDFVSGDSLSFEGLSHIVNTSDVRIGVSSGGKLQFSFAGAVDGDIGGTVILSNISAPSSDDGSLALSILLGAGLNYGPGILNLSDTISVSDNFVSGDDDLVFHRFLVASSDEVSLTYSITGGLDLFTIDSSSGAFGFSYGSSFDDIDGSGVILYDLEVEVSDGSNASISSFVVEVLVTDIDDTITGGIGGDIISGGGGSDLLIGGGGSDRLFGGSGDDVLAGWGGDDFIYGGSGDDNLTGGRGANTFDGGSGIDEVSYANSSLSEGGVTITLVDGNVYGFAFGGRADGDMLKNVEHLVGSNYADVLMGNSVANVLRGLDGNDVLDGGSGSDILDGGVGADELTGGSENDTLDGGVGDDTLTGGSGNDTFVVSLGGDTITDYVFGDSLSFENLSGIVGREDFTVGISAVGSSTVSSNLSISFDGDSDSDTVNDVIIFSNIDVNIDAVPETLASLFLGINYVPEIVNGDDSVSVYENSVDVFYRVTGSDIDGDSLTYSISGGSDSALFVIDSDTGEVSFKVEVAYDSASAVGVDNVYDLEFEVSDGMVSSISHELAVTILERDANVSLTNTIDDNGTLHGGSGHDYLRGGRVDDIIYGGAGNDRIIDNYGNDNLYGGAGHDYIWSDFGNDVIYGGTGNDTIISSAGDDVLYGGAGNDELFDNNGYNKFTGGAGADMILGSNFGQDVAIYVDDIVGVTVTLTDIFIYYRASTGGYGIGGHAEGDFLRDIDDLIGGSGNDVLTGNRFANVFEGGLGGDDIDGGGGIDTASYASDTGGVTITLAEDGSASGSVQISGGDAVGDMLRGIENLIGGSGDDVLTGNMHDNVLEGGAGRDELDGGSGDGIDVASYAGDITGVTVTLDSAGNASGTAQISGGDAWGDRLVSIENLIGGSGDDVLTGNSGANVLEGRAGDDVIDGGLGADIFEGGSGDDVLMGGLGDDIFEGGFGSDVINGGGGIDTVSYVNSGFYRGVTITLADDGSASVASGAEAESDTLVSIENLIGSDYDDVLMGNSGDNVLEGGRRGDIIDGRGGIDTASYASSIYGVTITLDSDGNASGRDQIGGSYFGHARGDILMSIENLTGGSGDDFLRGNALANVLRGGAGDDILEGGVGGDVLDGGAGNDMASFAGSAEAVVVTLASDGSAAVISGGDAQGDTFVGIEGLMGSSGNDVLTGNSGDNVFEGGVGGDVIVGGDGTDTASYASDTGGVTITLDSTGSASGIAQISGGEALSDTLSGIENLVGGSEGDVLRGNSGDNFLEGGAGGDILDGGSGNDTVSYVNSSENYYKDYFRIAGVTITLSDDGSASGTAQIGGGHAGGDVLSGIENIIGSGGVDRLTGNSGINILSGGSGIDTLEGGGGADILDGGEGIDTVSYASDDVGVTITLDANGDAVGFGGDANGDRLESIENLIGGSGDDVFVGNNSNNVFEGGAGSDTFTGGGVSDTVSYASDDAGVTITFGDDGVGVGVGGDAAGDILMGIEYIRGGSGADVLMANRHNKRLYGGAGADTLSGGAELNILDGGDGDDILIGGSGIDYLYGGSGIDTLSYANDTVGVRVTLFDSTTSRGSGGDAEGDRIGRDIENLIGGSGDDILRGNSVANVLVGGSGDDELYGGSGDDILEGGMGIDVLDGGSGTDMAIYASATTGVTITLDSTGSASGTAQISGEYAAGDTLIGIEGLIGGSGNDVLTGNSGNNVFEGGAGFDELAGGGGVDTASYASDDSGVTITLDSTGSASGTDQISGGDALSDTLSGIENLIGGSGDDILSGNSGVNVLEGGFGSDVINGGEGIDTVSYASDDVGVTITLDVKGSAVGVGGDAEGDRLEGIENITGGSGADVLMGNKHSNRLEGGAGNDIFYVGGGGDVFDGGAGSDIASFAGSAEAIIVTLASDGSVAVISGGESVGDSFISIEGLIGGSGNDVLTGNSGANVLEGGSGNDTLDGGGGADIIDGGGGVDTVSYASSIRGVTITLDVNGDAVGVGGDAEGDELTSIEVFIGGSGSDVFIGTDSDNVFEGGSGSDRYTGGGGVDTVSYASDDDGVTITFDVNGVGVGVGGDAKGDELRGIENITGGSGTDVLRGNSVANVLVGGSGGDVLDGGGGIDTASYANDTLGVTVTLSDDGSASVIGIGGHAAGDTLVSIENLIGGSGVNKLTGNSGANILSGGAGNDTLDGGGGDDILTGGSGGDYLYGGSGDDILTGGSGGDYLYGGGGNDTVSYANDTAGVTVTLLNDSIGLFYYWTFGSGGDAEDDYINREIENATGGFGNDVLTGGSGANVLVGGAGDDILEGGGGGDVLDGGDGNDTVSYDNNGGYYYSIGYSRDISFRSSAVTVTLADDGSASVVSGGHAVGDTFVSIENLIGSRGDDVLTGNSGANVLEGGLGGDTIVGGEGIDTASYVSDTRGVRITLDSAGDASGTAQIRGTFADQIRGSHAEGDSLSGIENLIGGSGSDRLTGNSVANVLRGGAGWDTLDGGAGDDTLDGGGGIDTLDGGAGDDTLTGGGDIDILDGGAGDDTLTGGVGADRFIASEGSDSIMDWDAYDRYYRPDRLSFADFVDITDSASADFVFSATADNRLRVTFDSDGASGSETASITFDNISASDATTAESAFDSLVSNYIDYV